MRNIRDRGSGRQYRRASFTVEAAVLLPMIVLIIIFLLYLILHMYQTVITYHSAYQSALRASLVPERTNEEVYTLAQEEFERLVEQQAIWTNGVSRQIGVDLFHITVAYQVNTSSPFTRASQELLGVSLFSAEGEVKLLKSNPVEWIRNARIVLNLIDRGEGES